MALIRCPECNREVSDAAKNCPHCGFPLHIVENGEQPKSDGVHYARPTGSLPKREEEPNKKRTLFWVVLIVIGMFAGCGACVGGSGSSSDSVQTESVKESIEYVSEDEIENVFSNPSDYYGKYIKLSGKVFSNPELGENEVSFQMFSDVENSEDNAYVTYKSENAKDVNDYEYVLVDGKIKGSISGTNVLGGVITALEIEAISVEESNYIDIVVPTMKELVIGETIEQFGYSVTLDKIEFAEKETRVYITVSNNGSDKFSVYTWSSKLVQDGKQYEPEMNFYYDYEEIQSDLLVGTSSSGVIIYPALDMNNPLQFYAEGSSNNWDEDIEPYVFDVTNE